MSKHNHTLLQQPGGIYFITATVLSWKHVFIKKTYLDEVINSLIFFQDKREVNTVGYCIMPNHLHWIFKLPETHGEVDKIIRTFKSFLAKQALDLLKIEVSEGKGALCRPFTHNANIRVEEPVRLLQYFAQAAEGVPSQSHRFWQRNSDLKLIETGAFLKQKLKYIHTNPVQPQWRLVEDPAAYQYSSCRFYELGEDWNKIGIEVT